MFLTQLVKRIFVNMEENVTPQTFMMSRLMNVSVLRIFTLEESVSYMIKPNMESKGIRSLSFPKTSNPFRGHLTAILATVQKTMW